MNYAALAATAKKLIASSGKSVTLTQVVPGIHDPVTGLETGADETVTVGSGVETAFEYGTMDLANTLQASKRLLCVGIPAPAPGDKLTVDGVDMFVVKTFPLSPGSTTLLYDLWVK